MLRKIAYLFPGQGAQYVGMGKDLYEKSSAAKMVFDKADAVFGRSLSDICFNGSKEQLKSTDISQPAILTVSIACLEALRKYCKDTQQEQNVLQPQFYAGLSLGEYSALVASGALSFQDAFKLVQKRGQFMEEAARKTAGSMAAIIGLDAKVVREICSRCGLYLANLNCPHQVVISGSIKNLEIACKEALNQGAIKAIKLEVSGAFHSPLMESASKKLSDELSRYNLNIAEIDVVCNTSAGSVRQPSKIKENLVKQVASTVLWEDSMRFMIEKGVSLFIEIGPGKVLKGLLKRIDSSVKVFNIENLADIEGVVSQLMEVVCPE